MIPLCTLPLHRQGRILTLPGEEPLHTRLLDLGFVPGGTVTPLLKAPLGDPRAYWVCGTLIGLRQADSGRIQVQPL
ncbi:MAG: ferrous iron transport protein A [Clostridia bacterium]|nr:ferrous iron transport protein A [Clostridia bacterium]